MASSKRKRHRDNGIIDRVMFAIKATLITGILFGLVVLILWVIAIFTSGIR
jgi:hypothetical protein